MGTNTNETDRTVPNLIYVAREVPTAEQLGVLACTEGSCVQVSLDMACFYEDGWKIVMGNAVTVTLSELGISQRSCEEGLPVEISGRVVDDCGHVVFHHLKLKDCRMKFCCDVLKGAWVLRDVRRSESMRFRLPFAYSGNVKERRQYYDLMKLLNVPVDEADYNLDEPEAFGGLNDAGTESVETVNADGATFSSRGGSTAWEIGD